jgi:hypothetical protein
MAMNNSPTENSQTTAAKKPYEKPAFRFEQVFVTSALTCGKTPGGVDSGCHLVASAS